MADHYKDAVASALSGGEKKPAKKIKRIEHEHSANGDHIFTHHHHHPEHHPSETHTKRGDDEMVEHMLQNAGTPNPGEAQADPNGADVSAANPAAGGAAPAPAAGPMQAPGA